MQNVIVDQVIDPGTRVTVAMGTDRNLGSGKQMIPPSDFFFPSEVAS